MYFIIIIINLPDYHRSYIVGYLNRTKNHCKVILKPFLIIYVIIDYGLQKMLMRSSYKLAVQVLYSVQSLSRVQLFATPWTTAHQASLSITNSRNLLKFISIESVMPSNHLTLCRPLSSRLQSFPASGSFQMNQLFASGGQCIGVSASTSVLPMNTQD